MLPSLGRSGKIVVAVWCCFANALTAKDSLEQNLQIKLLDASQTWSDVQQFVERRVPAVPPIRTADEWRAVSERIRWEVLQKVVFRGEAVQWRKHPLTVEYLETIPLESAGYSLKKLRYEALPGLWIPAVVYEPWSLRNAPEGVRVPVILSVNGHDALGKAAKYKQLRCIHLAKQGCLVLNVEWLGMGQLRSKGFSHGRMNQLDLCGTSGLAPFYLAMERALDLLLAQRHADHERVAVAGLSGGGWQTIMISALDPRVTLSNPVAGYSSFITRVHHPSDLGDSEQTPVDLATVADYTHLTAIRAPRPTLLTYNIKDDCCFASAHALPPLIAAAAPVFELFGKGDRLRQHINHEPGNHNFERDNREAFYHMLADNFSTASMSLATTEGDYESEVKSAQELNVAMPERNADFHSLAVELAASLPRGEPMPAAEDAVAAWRERRIEELRRIVVAHRYEIQATPIRTSQDQDRQFGCWKMRVGGEWTLAVLEWTPDQPQGTTILLADAGKATLAAQVEAALKSGQRVLTFDPFFFGECKIAERDYLSALLVSTVGERPLGVQASQLAAIAEWADHRYGQVVQLQTFGPRTGLIGMVSHVLARSHLPSMTLTDGPHSLHQVIDEDLSFEQRPEWFCFGLLENFDVSTLQQLGNVREIK